MKMYVDDMMPFTSIDIPSLSESILPTSASTHVKTDRKFETEILTDASAALDVSTFLWIRHQELWLRLCSVIGRILLLRSDYVQSENITPDEWALHVSMLVMSAHMLSRSAGPFLNAVLSKSTLSVKDMKAYVQLFEDVDVTALQFKTLLTSSALSWMEYSPTETVELNGDYMYYLYSGEVDGTDISDEEFHVSTRVFGDVQFAGVLDFHVSKKSKRKSKSTKSREKDAAPSSTVDSSFVVGPSGATMLRISTIKVLELIEHDNELSESFQRLVFQCMQEKLSSTLRHRDIARIDQPSNSNASPNATYALAQHSSVPRGE